MEPLYVLFKKHLKRLALPPWEKLHDTIKTSLLLWSSPSPQRGKCKAMREQLRICTGSYCAMVAFKTLIDPVLPADNGSGILA
jgi:hypothetical protein